MFTIVITEVSKKLSYREIKYKKLNDKGENVTPWCNTEVFFNKKDYKKYLKNGDGVFFTNAKVEFAKDCKFLKYKGPVLKKILKYHWCNFTNSAFVNHLSFLWHPINFFFLLKYPFMKERNVWSGRFLGYAYTLYEHIPSGWRKAFGNDLLKDIKRAGKKSRKRLHKHLSWRKMIIWTDIKEKYGTLRLYASATEEIYDVLEHYESISDKYCINCGKSAKYMTSGYIVPLCDECMKKEVNKKDKNGNYVYNEEYRNNYKTKNCIAKEE